MRQAGRVAPPGRKGLYPVSLPACPSLAKLIMTKLFVLIGAPLNLIALCANWGVRINQSVGKKTFMFLSTSLRLPFPSWSHMPARAVLPFSQNMSRRIRRGRSNLSGSSITGSN
nr:MAG TPA: hypothetical protein [Caudoviricetes sp.]